MIPKQRGILSMVVALVLAIGLCPTFALAQGAQSCASDELGPADSPDFALFAQADSQTVYIAKSSKEKIYHVSSTCSGMKNPLEMSFEDAQAQGYRACEKCSSNADQSGSSSGSAPADEPSSGGAVQPGGASGESASADSIAMYRLYNPYSGEHFYTADIEERASVREAGWFYEGIGWVAPGFSSDPVFRLYNPFAGEHHYTLDAAERDNLVAAGWTDEGTGWHSDDARAVPVYREYNPNEPANNHNYTADAPEHESLVDLGWVDEGVGWHALDVEVDDPYAKETEEDRVALQESEAAARHQAAIDVAVADGKYVFTGTVRVDTGANLMREQFGVNASGPSTTVAVLMFDEPQSVSAPQMGMRDPVARTAKSIDLDDSTWKSRAGERVTLAFDSVYYPGGVMHASLFSDSAPQELS